VRRLEGAGGGRGELVEHGLDVHGVAEAGSERGDRRLGVVARAVEARVDEPLDATTQRVEESRCGERGRGDADRARER
jgi:hypothetical protein